MSDNHTSMNESQPSKDKAVALAHWDGLFPPPAVIRCAEVQREQLDANTYSSAGCMLLDGHAGRCVFGE